MANEAYDPHPEMDWMHCSSLTIVVVGASGDLAKKKTFPSLLHLFADHLMPLDTTIWGFARSKLLDEDLRERLRPFLMKQNHPESLVEEFLSKCRYLGGNSYGDIEAFSKLQKHIEEHEKIKVDMNSAKQGSNRLFYFAIPPNVFAETALAIKETCMQAEDKGWTRLVVEKPFGRDLESFEELNTTLSKHFSEKNIYRIDHYLGKEMVQNLLVLRFSNIWFERVWSRNDIECVILTFKEPFGTEGRGGYFDQYGIIRDILQNHLLQVFTLLAMEPPTKVDGQGADKAIRDAKVAVLQATSTIQLENVVLGQYEGYADDPTITNKNTNTPTFAAIKLTVNTPRWDGVPFILKAGKNLNERKAEMRIQFKDTPSGSFLFGGKPCARNELVMRLQPDEAVYMKTNVKSPGFSAVPVQSELEVNYNTRFNNIKESNPDAYTRLILNVIQGKQSAFVRDDELRRAWEIFTPVLHQIENENVSPIMYKPGSRGPQEADDFIEREAGYLYDGNYTYFHGEESS